MVLIVRGHIYLQWMISLWEDINLILEVARDIGGFGGDVNIKMIRYVKNLL